MLSQTRRLPLNRHAFRFLGCFALLPAAALGVTITVNGTYNASATTNAYTAPNAHWTLSFEVASTPSVNMTDATQFRTDYTNAAFTLNGASVPVTGNTVIFFNSGGSSFNIFPDSPVNKQFIVKGPPLFSGSTSNPTMVAGSYTATAGQSATNNPAGGFWG